MYSNVAKSLFLKQTIANYMDKLRLEDGFLELNVEEHLRPSLERKLIGTTKTDSHIQSLPIPHRPYATKIAVIAIRIYRKLRPESIGNRCVFEPSCSHYGELAIRKNGVFIGVKLTIQRLLRCRPGNGGLDL